MLLVIRKNLPSYVKISKVLICYLYSNLWYIHIQQGPLCLGYLCGVSGYGLLNIAHLCHAYYAAPFPRMEFYHFIHIEQCVKCMCISIMTYNCLCFCFSQGCSSKISRNYVWRLYHLKTLMEMKMSLKEIFLPSRHF